MISVTVNMEPWIDLLQRAGREMPVAISRALNRRARGGGKTTTLTMLIMAVTGLWPAAAAWSRTIPTASSA